MSPTADQLWQATQTTGGDLNCILAATEAQDTAAFAATAVPTGGRNADLAATESQDTATITCTVAAAPVIVQVGGSGHRYTPRRTKAALAAVEMQDTASFSATVLPWRAALAAAEAQDRAGFSAVQDFSDEDVVLALMAAAWSDDGVYV